MLDIYLKEVKLITKIREHVLNELLTQEDMSVKVLQENLDLVKMLQAKQSDLDTARLTMQNLGSRPALQAAKSVTAAIAGIIFLAVVFCWSNGRFKNSRIMLHCGCF
ncbi:hypothetical protein [Legionella tunisiensis]|uniref:hypothetical protein n=1 Tax=Legionella tunisiensis TaxID=1034944 RepID=UPI0002F7FA0E|nr:hypothetical protein [Legionella tunisiensis]